ncbi:hypothetical protein PSTG_13600 [Puccinia striiformis f. sp. tritici PST-78]|uniref:Uncharacterized protein n=1 Tax=Puccinia striiformis f. sp. tritici PST-78 TaxID=1165861 RepID=A0A0L0V158_9BASI|nr:hypothetical protein PSTG_13600 [Puccinia striiformis f. sp. tritici PST-78]
MFAKPASLVLLVAALLSAPSALKPELAADSQACQAQLQPSPSSFSNGVKFAPSLVDVPTSSTREPVSRWP